MQRATGVFTETAAAPWPNSTVEDDFIRTRLTERLTERMMHAIRDGRRYTMKLLGVVTRVDRPPFGPPVIRYEQALIIAHADWNAATVGDWVYSYDHFPEPIHDGYMRVITGTDQMWVFERGPVDNLWRRVQ